MIPRPDLLDTASPPGLEIFQLTHNPDLPACHISMEAQVCTPDSRFFVFHEGVGVQSYDHKDPRHRLLLGDATTGAWHPIGDEPGVVAPVVSPDGRFVYYFIDEAAPGTGRILLCRRNLDGSGREILSVLDGPVPGTRLRPCLPRHNATISSDGERIANCFFLGDGKSTGGPYGLLVFDLRQAVWNLALLGCDWWNMHAQYCRSTDPELAHDLLLQQNHDGVVLPDGRVGERPPGGMGADIHAIRDDGRHFRNLPWGRSPAERVVGHQCWRGRTGFALGSVIAGPLELLREKRSPLHVIESLPCDHCSHAGGASVGANRNVISGGFDDPHFNHIASDLEGRRMVADFRTCWDPGVPQQDAVYLFELDEPGAGPARRIEYLFSPRSSWRETAHVHPFFAPDGKTLYFNSDESGQTQAYMARNLPF